MLGQCPGSFTTLALLVQRIARLPSKRHIGVRFLGGVRSQWSISVQSAPQCGKDRLSAGTHSQLRAELGHSKATSVKGIVISRAGGAEDSMRAS
jgi:hypothetical protein